MRRESGWAGFLGLFAVIAACLVLIAAVGGLGAFTYCLWRQSGYLLLGFLAIFAVAFVVNPVLERAYLGIVPGGGIGCGCLLMIFATATVLASLVVFGWFVLEQGIHLLLIYLGAAVVMELLHRMVGHQPTWRTRLFAPFLLVPAYLFYRAGLRWSTCSFDGQQYLKALAAYFVFGHTYVYLWKFDNRWHQHRIEKEAGEILALVTSGGDQGNRRFVLYLRPFLSTTQLASGARSVDGMTQSQHIDMEVIFQRVFGRRRSFVALGRPGEAEGAARILTSDEDWWKAFTALAENAELIVLLPSAREGTFREIQWIFETKAFGKCVIFMPATVHSGGIDVYQGPKMPLVRIRYGRRYFFYPEEEWAEVRDRLRSLHVELPAYDPGGALIRLDDNGTVHKMAPLELHRRLLRVRRTRKAVEAVLRDDRVSDGG